MARYIDAEKAIRHLRGACVAKYPASFYHGIFVSADEIDKMPTADVVEVVRCRNCIYFKESEVTNSFYCDWHREYYETYPNEFCSYGERKDT